MNTTRHLARAVAAAAALVTLSCAHSKVLDEQVQVHVDQVDQVNKAVEISADQRVQFKQRRLDVAGAVEHVRAQLAPDGHVTSLDLTRWAPSTSEAWLTSSMGADEHVAAAAARTTTQKLEAAAKSHLDAQTRAGPPASLWWLLLALALLVAGLAGLAWHFKPPWLAWLLLKLTT